MIDENMTNEQFRKIVDEIAEEVFCESGSAEDSARQMAEFLKRLAEKGIIE